jgi:hypothetical protein
MISAAVVGANAIRTCGIGQDLIEVSCRVDPRVDCPARTLELNKLTPEMKLPVSARSAGSRCTSRCVSAKYGGITIFAGVPTGWRTLSGDAGQETGWIAVYRSVDVISPWAVGRYGTIAAADEFRHSKIESDLAEAKRIGVGSMPVIFPGFSWHNLAVTRRGFHGAINLIPRYCGRFYWHQLFNALDAGSTMVFTAMFDEVDEGTAILLRFALSSSKVS